MTSGEASVNREVLLREVGERLRKVSLWGPGGVGRLDGPQVQAACVEAVARMRADLLHRDPLCATLLQIREMAIRRNMCPVDVLAAWSMGLDRLREAEDADATACAS